MTTTAPSRATDLPLSELAAGVRGALTLPSDPGYDEARAVYNGAVDRRPAALVRCADVADVIACVNFAREHDMTLAIRGGGHNGGGLGVWDDALVIDLGGLRSTTVNPAAQTVRVDGGCTWGDVDHATGAFGMATPSGFISTTGVGGQTLGGGIGYLSRRFGLSVDNLLSADVVLADGSFVTASHDSHQDLFWALRGGGGNFGVVTSFTFACHEIGENGTVIAGPVFYDIADTEAVFRWYRELLPALPEELSGWIGMMVIAPESSVARGAVGTQGHAASSGVTRGRTTRADDVLAAVREFGSPLLVGLQPMPYWALQSAFDALAPKGLQWYWKADFFTEITDEAIALHKRYGEAIPTQDSTAHLYPISGAVTRVAEDATAFAYRGGGWAGVIVGVDPDPENLPRITEWTRKYWEELHSDLGGRRLRQLHDGRRG